MTVVDHEGTRLHSVVLQVVERDGERPRILRYLRDDETVSLANEEDRRFLIVWVATDIARAETGISALHDQFIEVKEAQAKADEQRTLLQRDIDWVRSEHAKITAELDEKTTELRRLQRERDPERVERAVAERVTAATATLQTRLDIAKAENAALKQAMEDLVATKKKLRDALERAKRDK